MDFTRLTPKGHRSGKIADAAVRIALTKPMQLDDVSSALR